MSDIVVDVSTRDTNKEKNSKLRSEGMIPAVVYGASVDPLSLKVSEMEYIHKIRGKVTSSTYIDIKVNDADVKTVYIKEIQKNPVKNVIEHIDFIEVDPNHKVHLTINVVLNGDAYGVVSEGGVLEFLSRTIEIECLPKNNPGEIVVDVADLKAGESIHAGDINLAEGVKLMSAKDATIVAVVKEEPKPEAQEDQDSAE